MDIQRALQLKIGNTVACPPDRREPGYRGTVTNVSPIIATSHNGDEYIWVEVKTPFGHKSVWPSNRLGTTMGELRDACLGVAA